MTYYYDNNPVEIEKPKKTKYPRRLFYKLKYKDGEKVVFLCDEIFGHKTIKGQPIKGQRGYIYAKAPYRRGEYYVMFENIFHNGQPCGVSIKAKGIKKI